MTREQRREIACLRADGHSYASIAKKYGVSRQCICKIMNAPAAPKNREERYIYPNIVRWMNQQDITLTAFSELLGVSIVSLHNALTGKRKPNIKVVENVPVVTGLPFEVAFERKEKNNA